MNRFLPLILSALCLYGGCKLANINSGKTSEANKETKKSLCENGVKTTAILQNEYTEMEIGSSVSYQYKFDYEVDGKTYTGNHSVSEELAIPILEVRYDKTNPSSVTTSDPCVTYEKIKDLPGKYPDWMEYVGIGIFLLGLGFGQSSIVRAIKGNKA
jgi:hypothetical protein